MPNAGSGEVKIRFRCVCYDIERPEAMSGITGLMLFYFLSSDSEGRVFAYFAFKALTGRYPNALSSARQKTPWETDPALGLPYLKAEEGTFGAGHGVYAATVEEAQRYTQYHQGDVYLVAPLPGKHAVVGEEGWRAEGAICLKPLTQENQAQIGACRFWFGRTCMNEPLRVPCLRTGIAHLDS